MRITLMHQYPQLTADGCEAEGLAVRWQDGPITEGRFNGATIEVLIRAAILRLDYYQAGPTRCGDNALILQHLHAALAQLDNRTRDRYQRGVIGQELP